MLKRFLAYSKVAIPLLLGICIGIALSFIILPFIEERTCEWDSSYAFTLKRHTKAVKNNGNRFSDGIDLDSFQGSEFDPLVIESKQSGAHSVKKPVRQRFAHSEIDMKEPIFIGYLSSPDQLKNRLVALNKTLVSSATLNSLPVKFFINASKKQADQSDTLTASPIVALNLLDVNLLPLISLKHMANQYGRRYKYFMLTPDTVYTKHSLTEGISSLKDEEPCFCFASDDKTDCDYSTGLFISNSVLMTLSRSMEECEHLFRVKDNSEMRLTRSQSFEALHSCIHHITQTSCTPLSNSQYVYGDESSSLEDALESVHTMIISDVKTPTEIYTIRKLEALLEMEQTKLKISSIRGGMEHLLTDVGAPVSWPAGVNEKYQTSNRYDVLRWTLIADNASYLEYDLKNSRPLSGDYKRDVDDMVDAVMKEVNRESERFQLIKLIQAYRLADPTRGLDNKLTLALRDSVSGTSEVRTVELVKAHTSFQMKHLHSTSTDSTHVEVVVPVYNAVVWEVDTLVGGFIEKFRTDRHITLNLILMYSASEYRTYQLRRQDIFQSTKQRISELSASAGNIRMVAWKEAHGDAITLASLIHQISTSLSVNSIICLSTITTHINPAFISRVRRNTIQGRQAFAPIAFYQYNLKFLTAAVKPNTLEVARMKGHFASQWYEHLSFHIKDLPTAQSLEKLGSSLEDLLIKSGLELLRAPDSDCLVKHKEWDCEVRSIDLNVCRAKNTDHIASAPMLASKLLEEGVLHTNGSTLPGNTHSVEHEIYQ